MAQVRDSQTSELLYDGTPAECVALAAEVGSVLYDDVGLVFDPAAVEAGAEADGGLPDIPPDDVAEAEQARADAHARVARRRGGSA
jgi:hypothetical protein